MGRIKNQNLYPLDEAIDLGEYLIGTDSNGNATLNYQLDHLFRTFITLGNGFFIRFTDVEDVSSLFDYHGGTDYKGEWLIIRYERGDVNARTIANTTSNPSIVDISDAWANKITLTYN